MPVETRRSNSAATAAAGVAAPDSPPASASTTTTLPAPTLTTDVLAHYSRAARDEIFEYQRLHPQDGGEPQEKAIVDAARDLALFTNLPIEALLVKGTMDRYIDVRGLKPRAQEALARELWEEVAAARGLKQMSPISSDDDEDLLSNSASSEEDCRQDEELEAIRHEIAELEQEIDISKQYKIVDRLGEGASEVPLLYNVCFPNCHFISAGTFSSVYKAIDCKHAFYDNGKWASKRAPLSIQGLLQHSNSSNSSFSSASSTSSTSTSASSLSLVGALKRKHKRSSSSSSNSPYSRLMTARKLLKQVTEEESADNSKSKVYVALKRIYVTSSPQRIWNELDILGLLRNARHTAYLISAMRHEDQVIAVMPYEKHQDFRVSLARYRSTSRDPI